MANKKMITYAAAINLIGDTIPYVNASDLAIQSMASNKLITYAKAKALIDDTKEDLARYNGIYIVDKNGKFYRTSAWNTSNNSNASGVAVIDPSASFIIAPVELTDDPEDTDMQWGGYGIIIPGIPTSSEVSDIILNDYNGEANTTVIINTLGVYNSAAVAAAMYIEEDIIAANNEAAAIPQTLSLEDDLESTNVFDPEEYSVLLDKQAKGTLTEEESSRLREIDSLRIKQEFMEKYNIMNDTVLYILLEKIRQRLKTNIDIAQLNSLEKYVDTEDIDNLTDDTIMRIMLKNDKTQAEEKPVVYGAVSNYDYAANGCRNYIFKHGKAGFLPAVGQLMVVAKWWSSINSALTLIGAPTMYWYHWSSSQVNKYDSWQVWVNEPQDPDNCNKNVYRATRPFCSIS